MARIGEEIEEGVEPFERDPLAVPIPEPVPAREPVPVPA